MHKVIQKTKIIKMKQRISVTIDEKKMKLVETLLENDSRFRNKSHFIEYSLDKALKEEMKHAK